jgi:UDP-N-acetylmuramoyl-L-alanyl-D-glutamate--2,6-diaminopimelate ligase
MSGIRASIEPISLRQVLSGAESPNFLDLKIRSCASDSRHVEPGDVFVAIAGNQVDAHDSVSEAVSRGAVAIVSERPLELPVPVLVVSDSREALGHICQALAGEPSKSLRVVGVTGTNGKTTTSHLIASIFEAAGLRAGLLGTLGYCDSIKSARARWTTPPAWELASWLRSMAASGCSHAVVEVSSHAVCQRRVAGIEFAQACLTNLRRDHLDYHGSLSEYHRAKINLFAQLSSQGLAVINVDDPASRAAAPLLPHSVMTIAIERPADVTAMIVDRSKSDQTFLLTAGRITLPVRTAMIGEHHVYNCLSAAAVALAEGIDLVKIARGLEQVECVPGRLQRLECGQPFGVYVDFAHTPDALTFALAALREVTVGRVICVFGAGGNRDVQKRPLMGQAVEKGADLTIVTSDNSRLEDPRTIASEILQGFERPDRARWMPDRKEAIEYALSLAGPDDCVLIAGRGHETHQEIGHERVPLDDRQVARGYLYGRAPASAYAALATATDN